ncbi:hypothetical protein [Bacillus thuringiensis]|uniref:hypothetical protein n=3 Tax=Bacillus thuringiensis TaxID=1428 RepID=UPI00130066C3|nr:hypothetical protein [Bacillus thuringiensis]
MNGLKQDEYGRNPYMMHPPQSYPLEGLTQSAAAIDDAEQVQSHVSFCSLVQIPQGFLYVPNGTRKLAYSLSGLSVVKETCLKTITVDNCGPVEVTLNLLKVVGSIPYLVNAQVQGECGEKLGGQTGRENQIELSHTGHIPVNAVLKFSVANLPDYQIQEENLEISTFEVTPIQEQDHYFLRFTGTLSFRNIPQ